jgi:flagellar hook-associated protein 2
MDLRLTGLASGFDWQSLVDQLTEIERTPQRRLRDEQNVLEQRNNAYGSLVTQLSVLQTRVDALKDAALFDSRSTTVGDTTVASATASTGVALGVYTFAIAQLATASSQQGTANAGSALNPTNDVSGLVLSGAAFATAVTEGTFTINGEQVEIEATDSLQEVFDKISSATGGAVTGSYDSATDRITLSSGSAIVLGSASDSSNFLQVAKLYNNGTGTLSSASALGAVRVSASLNSANLQSAIDDNGGSGAFAINGMQITFNASDTVNDVLARINNSAAGVTASYDPINDRFTLTNKVTGDLGVALEDVSGNFLAATGLLAGTLQRGKNLLYTVNGGGQLVSQSNTITEASSGITGLSVTALKEGASTTVEVTSDTAKIKTAISDFIEEYNRAQSMIDAQTAIKIDAKGKVTTAILASQSDAEEIASKLRKLANTALTGLAGSIRQLDALGIVSNGNDNTLALADSAKLDAALAQSLSEVEDLFDNGTSGLAVQLSALLETTVGDEGTLATRQDTLAKQIAAIDTQIADLERVVLSNQERLIQSFVAMERARASINQQNEFLNQRLGLQ